ncbi:MAG: hypothetical protein BWX79_00283 [Alphaproteobacteria bacterium ADurb.Bin100]|nr:MAG: hypothetical protein BWX79_00283 [Alphaproteobacteria bacterium ADurb.Bin100]
MRHRNAELLQIGRSADARELQQLRRAEGAGGQNHLAPRLHGLQGATLVVGDAGGAPAFQRHLGRDRMGDDLEIGARQVGREEGLGRAATLAVLVRDLVLERAGLFGTVVVRIQSDAVGGGGLQKQLVDGALVLLVGHVQRAALAMETVGELLVVFRALEQRQHLVVRPAGVAQRGPVVVVPAVAAHVEHGVDGA